MLTHTAPPPALTSATSPSRSLPFATSSRARRSPSAVSLTSAALHPSRAHRSDTNFGLTRDERQHALRRRWGFTCTCDLCSAGADATAASDARRRRVVSLRGELVAHLEKGAFAAAIFAYEHELLDLVRAEHLAEHLGEHFEVLARLHLATGNRTAAGTYAQQALDEMAAFGRAAIDDDEDSEAATSVRELRAIVKALGGKAAPRSTEEEGTTGA